MPATEKIVLTSEELKYLRKLFLRVSRDKSVKKTKFIPEMFNTKYLYRNVSWKVLERCYNQDENEDYSDAYDSDIDVDKVRPGELPLQSTINASNLNSLTYNFGQEEIEFLTELLKKQMNTNILINNKHEKSR